MISGYIKLADSGETTITVTDENIVANSLSITMSTCGSEFMIGTFNAAILKISVIDDDAVNHDFSNAKITLQEIKGGTTTYLGSYWVDGSKTKRVKNAVNLTAQDASAAFDKELDSSIRGASDNVLNMTGRICSAVGIVWDSTVIPTINLGTMVQASSQSIQTYRDYVIWICQILGANAVIDRNGRFTFRKTLYPTDSEGHIIPDRIITADERADIEFSDERVFIKYLSSYSAGKAKEYVSSAVSHYNEGRAGRLRLLYNPLTEKMAEEQCDEINTNILNYLTNTSTHIALYQQRIKAKLFSASDIWLGETIRFTGGKIDTSNTRITSMVTQIVWRYNGFTTVTCTAPEAERG